MSTQYQLDSLENPKAPLLQLNEEEIRVIRQSWELGTYSNTNFEPPKRKSSKDFVSTKTSTISTATDGSASAMFGLTGLWIMVYEDLIRTDSEISHFMPTIQHMTVQYASILMMAVENLEDLRSTRTVLERIGRTHARVFNVEHRHFRLLGESISRVLEKLKFDLRIIDIWMQIYGFLANTMIQAGTNLITFNDDASQSPYTVFVEVNSGNDSADGLPIELQINGNKPKDHQEEEEEEQQQQQQQIKRNSMNHNTLKRYKTISSNPSTIVEESLENDIDDCVSLLDESILYHSETNFRDSGTSSSTLVGSYRDTLHTTGKKISSSSISHSVMGRRNEKTLGMRIFGKFSSSNRAITQ